jgi:hypothetical protein
VCIFGDVVSNGITPLRRMVETQFLVLSDPTGMRKKIYAITFITTRPGT